MAADRSQMFRSLAKLCDVAESTAFPAQRQAVLLGFVTIAQGPRPRNAYRLADGWRGHDAVEAMRLRKQARLPKPKAAPKSVAKLRVARQRPSLPRMPWDDVR